MIPICLEHGWVLTFAGSQGVRQSMFLSGGSEEGSTPKFIQVLGQIQFLVVVGLLFLFSY